MVRLWLWSCQPSRAQAGAPPDQSRSGIRDSVKRTVRKIVVQARVTPGRINRPPNTAMAQGHRLFILPCKTASKLVSLG